MATTKELFINALQVVQVDDRENVPTTVFFDKSGVYVGHQAIDNAADPTELNENFKLNLGESARNRLDPPKFDTGDGKQRSAHEITKAYIEGILKHVKPWVSGRGLKPASRVLVAEPLALDRTNTDAAEWLSNYRAKLRAILDVHFKEVDFLPEPFAVFQYYRYGVRHPLLTSNTRHAALVIDFGGGTFDVSVVDTTAKGDVSGSGRNSRPLAAASIPVGGSFINLRIAKDLLAKNLGKAEDKSKVSKGWEAFKDGSYQDLRSDLRQFVRNVKRVVSQVEKAKLHICDTLADWSLDAQYSPGPAMQISVPKNPFSENPEFVPVRFDANQLRKVFVDQVWHSKLRPAVMKTIERAKEELGGRSVNIILLSGGSANIRWLTNLMRDLLPSTYPDAEILELRGSFQEVVSKGLAIECARRTFNQGTSDFQSITYNRLCLVLGADDESPTATRFRTVSEGGQNGPLSEGTLLESAHLIGEAQDKPLRWKFRLPSPPKHHLDYYFLKSSLDYEDIKGLYNLDHRVATPKSTTFDSNIVLELRVAPDGTARPKFIYKQAGLGSAEISVDGTPFFLDMTYGEKTTLGDAYVGIDFGTSNSSISYVEQQAVRVYTERATEKGWCELNDLVNFLPYPASNPLVKFVGSANERDLKDRFPSAFESLLFCILTVAFVDYRVQPEAIKSKFFSQFTKGSAGPIWATLRSILEKKTKKAIFIPKLIVLLEPRNKAAIDSAISAINDHKHHRESNYQGYREVLAILGNTLNLALEGWRFGQFEEVIKKGFSSVYNGLFRAAHGAHSPFVDIYHYQGGDTFSNMEAVLVSPEDGLAFRLSPNMFWTQTNAKGEQDIAVLDSLTIKSSGYRTIAGGIGISIEANSELAELHRMCNDVMQSDSCEFGVPCSNIQLTAR
jgi:molecular chaperone DnaK (HSP70)